MIKQLFGKMWGRAATHNQDNIMGLLGQKKDACLLDIGCHDGSFTSLLANAAGTSRVYGVDINTKALESAEKIGITCSRADVNDKIPFQDDMFDIVHANQVIEHVANIDIFVAEIKRVLKKSGYVIVSTENGSSWVNIGALIFGWQMFSLTNLSSRISGLGNPLALHRGEDNTFPSGWTHKIIFSYLGLKELFETYGFHVEGILGAGYFPLPSFLGTFDVRHSHFITIKARKTT